jgi:hypothetical protein
MNKVIILQGGSLENYYNLTMDYLYAKYHRHPLHHAVETSPTDVGQSSGFYEQMALSSASEAQVDGSDPVGKLVV